MHAATALSPAARASDPYTSHEAAAAITASGLRTAQQRTAAAAVTAHPGLTSLELSRASGVDRYLLARRLPECEDVGAVVRGAPRKCGVSGRTAVTWHAPGTAVQQPLPVAA